MAQTKKNARAKKKTLTAKAKKLASELTEKVTEKMAARGMDVTKLLKKDHQKVKMMFTQLEGMNGRATAKKRNLFEELAMDLGVHAMVEEEIFYPAVRELRAKEAKEHVLEALEEHSMVKLMLRQMKELGTEDETFNAKAKVLKEMVLHHAKEEEKTIFPEMRDGCSDEELQELGMRIQERKDELMAGGMEELEAEEERSIATIMRRAAV